MSQRRSAFFDVWSRFYDLPPVQMAVYRPVHQTVLRQLRERPAPRVLDVGSGTGILTARLVEELAADLVAGCDFSLGMLRQARERNAGVGWMQGDALRLPVRDAASTPWSRPRRFTGFPTPTPR